MKHSITASRYAAPPPPADFNIARYCLEAAASQPGKTALLFIRDAESPSGDQSWSYARLSDAVQRLASVIRAFGVAPGERILVRLDNSVEMAIAFLAANAAGGVPIPVSSLLTGPEVEFVADDSAAVLTFADPNLPLGRACDSRKTIEAADIQKLIQHHDPAPFAPTKAEDPGFLIYTSGTTSKPKGVLHAQRSLWGRRPMRSGWYDLHPSDIVLHAGALNWTYTLGTGFMDPLSVGATSAIYAGERQAQLWPALIERTEATLFAAVPTVYRQILKYCSISPDSFPSLRHGLSAGETLRPEVAAEWTGTTGRRLYEAFGMSEISTYVSSSPAVLPKPGSPGRPQEGRAVAILPAGDGEEPVPVGEPGVIAIHRSDPGLMLGYLNRPDEASFRGEWFVTGDTARMDEDGYLWPEGRGDDLMNVLGYRVSPAEVEAALLAHPGVAEAAAVAVEVRPGVSIIRAFVVPEAGSVSPADILEHARQRLAAYKMPKDLVVRDALPRTANGKIRRDLLRSS